MTMLSALTLCVWVLGAAAMAHYAVMLYRSLK